MTPPDALNIIESNLDYLIQTDQLESTPTNRRFAPSSIT